MQISFVNYKTVSKNKDFRIDAEYYKPIYFKIADILNTRFEKLECIECICDAITNGHTPYHHDLSKGNIKFITAEFIDDFTVLETDKFILEEDHRNYLKRSILKNGDIIFAIKGKIGHATPIFDIEEDININQDIARLSIKKGYNIFYVSAFLNCKYGRLQAEKESTGQINPFLGLSNLKNIKILFLEIYFQELIEEIIKKAHYFIKNAQLLYYQAEQILLSELDLLNWKPKHQLSFIKNYSDTQTASRIDAEYFQPMYEEIVKSVTSPKEYTCLGDLVSIKKCIEPGSEAYQEKGILFLRVSNLSKFGIKDGNQQYLTEELYRALKQHQPKKGEILLSKDATPGIAYYLKDEQEKMIPSGGILRLTVKDEDKLYPEYLTLVLNSVIVQKQIERDVGGSVINHWLVDQVKNTLIPILPVTKQKEIAKMVNDSFCNRELSKKLLHIAKRGVELAIEKDENQAKEWIDGEVKKLNTSFKKSSIN